MKAVQLFDVGQPLRMQELPIPEVGPGDVLVHVRAAGICHSDVHYRAGKSPVHPLPLTLGHEVAGVVAQVGSAVTSRKPGDRVCLHYLVTCGTCLACSAGREQFCDTGLMLGHYTPGGYAEYIVVPERNAVPLPDEIPFEHGAIMMCSSSTVLHALRKARLQGGERVAIFGVGGLGISAVQLAQACGALDVFAVDLNSDKLRLAESFGAIPIDARRHEPVAEIRRLTGGHGVDVALELIGLPQTIKQAVQALGVMGRAVVVGISEQPVVIDTYRELLGKEAELIGSNDHLLPELPLLLDFARRGKLDLSGVVTRTVPLEAAAINAVLDELEHFSSSDLRTVIVP